MGISDDGAEGMRARDRAAIIHHAFARSANMTDRVLHSGAARFAAWPRSFRSPTPAPPSRARRAATASLRAAAPAPRRAGPLADTRGRRAARPAHLGHRPLQLPLRLLHAEGGLRPRLPVPAARRAADLRGDRAPRARLRRPRRREDPPHRRRAAAAPQPRAAGRDARATRRPRPHAHHQRLAAREEGARAARRRARRASRSASTRSTTRRSAR